MSRPGTKNIHCSTDSHVNFTSLHCTCTEQPALTHLLPCDFFVFGRRPPERDSSQPGRLDAYPCSASATKITAIPSKSADYGTAKIDGCHVDVCV